MNPPRKKSDVGKNPPDDLRRRAEDRLKGGPSDISAMSAEEVQALVQELRIHQVELQLQNENLRATQEELSKARDRYFDLYELAPVGYLTLGEGSCIRSANLTAAEILGVERGKLIGMRLESLLASKDRDACYLLLKQAAADRTPTTSELRLRTDDGSAKWAAVTVSWLQPDAEEPAEWRVLLRDITRRKEIEHALQESETRARLAQEAAKLGVYDFDLLTQELRWDQRLRDLWGLKPDAAVTYDVFLSGLHPDDRPATEAAVTRALDPAGSGDYYAEYRVINRKDGQTRWIAATGRVTFEHGRAVRLIGIVQDITDRMLAEQERGERSDGLQRLNEELEERVAERTSMLKLLNDIATAANESHSFEEALAYALKRVSEHNGWCFGHAYSVEKGGPGLLVPVRTYYEPAPARYRRFRAATLRTRLRSGEGLPGRAYARRDVAWANVLEDELTARRAQVGAELGLRCGAAFPVFAGDDVVAVLEFFSDKQVERSDRLMESMAGIGTQLGRVIERERFERHLAGALLAEQQRVGQDLHDTVGQELAGLALTVEGMAGRAEAGNPPDAAALSALAANLRQALQHTRSVVRGLLPPVVAHAGAFGAALEELAASVSRGYGIACEAHCSTSLHIEVPEVATHLYRIAAEAVANAAKHAKGREIRVLVYLDNDLLVLEVRDDGAGIPEEAWAGGSGLRIMRHRAKVIGASLDIQRIAEGGTAVICRVPQERLSMAVHEEDVEEEEE